MSALILGHKNPDSDSIISAIACAHLYKQRGLDVVPAAQGTPAPETAFILERFRARLRFFPVSQQALTIGVLLLNDRVISAGLHLLTGVPQLPWLYWAAPLAGMLLWPPLHLLLDFLRLRRPG